MSDPNHSRGTDALLREHELAPIGRMREIASLLEDARARRRSERALLAEPEFAALYRERAHLPAIIPEPGERCDTLAAMMRDFRAWYGLVPEFLPGPELASSGPLEFAAALLTRDHDLYHVLCEYETSDRDEVALQSFLCGQAPCVFASFIVSVLHTRDLGAQRFKHLRDVLEAELDREAFARGRRAHTLVTRDFAALAHTPVPALRRMLAIEPCPLRSSAEALANTCGGRLAPPYFSPPSAAGIGPM
jgi:hypothetical protein